MYELPNTKLRQAISISAAATVSDPDLIILTRRIDPLESHVNRRISLAPTLVEAIAITIEMVIAGRLMSVPAASAEARAIEIAAHLDAAAVAGVFVAHAAGATFSVWSAIRLLEGHVGEAYFGPLVRQTITELLRRRDGGSTASVVCEPPSDPTPPSACAMTRQGWAVVAAGRPPVFIVSMAHIRRGHRSRFIQLLLAVFDSGLLVVNGAVGMRELEQGHGASVDWTVLPSHLHASRSVAVQGQTYGLRPNVQAPEGIGCELLYTLASDWIEGTGRLDMSPGEYGSPGGLSPSSGLLCNELAVSKRYLALIGADTVVGTDAAMRLFVSTECRDCYGDGMDLPPEQACLEELGEIVSYGSTMSYSSRYGILQSGLKERSSSASLLVWLDAIDFEQATEDPTSATSSSIPRNAA